MTKSKRLPRTTKACKEDTSRRPARHRLSNIPEEPAAERRGPAERRLQEGSENRRRSPTHDRWAKSSPGEHKGVGGRNDAPNRMSYRKVQPSSSLAEARWAFAKGPLHPNNTQPIVATRMKAITMEKQQEPKQWAKRSFGRQRGWGGGARAVREKGPRGPVGEGASPNRSGGASTRGRPTPHMDASG
jgi:hypothetical protein